MQTGRPQSLSSLWRSVSLRKHTAISRPLTAACNQTELINPKLACHSSGTLMEVSSFPEVYHRSLKHTFSDILNHQFSSFPKRWVNCTGSRTSHFSAGSWPLVRQLAGFKSHHKTRVVSVLGDVTIHHHALCLPLPWQQKNCSSTPARTSEDPDPATESPVLQMTCC